MSDAPDRRSLLDRLGVLCAAGSTFDIAEAALTLSALRKPVLDLDPYRQHLATLVNEATDLARRRRKAGEALREVLATGYGYRGDGETYDDPQNADLASVIDRRRGLPVALSVVWLHVARAVGWRCSGLAFPGHFLIRLDSHDGAEILDPFAEGIARGPADLRALLKAVAGDQAELRPRHVAAVSDRDVLLRLENNVRTRALKAEDGAAAALVLERMTTIAPTHPELWYEAGVLNARLDNVGAAIRGLQRFLELESGVADPEQAAPHARARRAAEELLRDLRRRLN